MISNFKANVKNNFILFCFFRRLWLRPYLLGLDFVLCYFYSLYLSYKLFGFSISPKVFFSSDIFRVIIVKSAKSKVSSTVPMALIFESFQHGIERTVLIIREGAHLEICNTFHIGNGCAFSLAQNAKLKLVGKLDNFTSGITCQSKILCTDDIHIGGGVIISWNVFITDSNNHYINGILLKKRVYIDDHVWISEGCTIAPGSLIGKGSIIGAKSFVNAEFVANSLIAGCPAKIKKTNVSWAR